MDNKARAGGEVMAVTYTKELHQDIVERLEMQAVVCNATPRTAPAINVLEALALLAEINRLNTRLATAEGRLGRVAASHPDAYLAALGGDEE